MYCPKCGKYNSEGKVVCMYCGAHMNSSENNGTDEKKGFYQSDAWKNSQKGQAKKSYPNYYKEDKTGTGILMAIFLGIIGLFIGLSNYPQGTYSRQSFISGWIKGFIIEIVIVVVLILMVACGVGCVLCSYY